MLEKMNLFNNHSSVLSDKSRSNSLRKKKQNTLAQKYLFSKQQPLSQNSMSFNSKRKSSSPANDKINNYLKQNSIEKKDYSYQRKSNQSFEGTNQSFFKNSQKKPPLKPRQKGSKLNNQFSQSNNTKHPIFSNFQKELDNPSTNILKNIQLQKEDNKQITTFLKDIYGYNSQGKLVKQNFELKINPGKGTYKSRKFDQIDGQKNNKNNNQLRTYRNNSKEHNISRKSSYQSLKKAYSPSQNYKKNINQKSKNIPYNSFGNISRGSNNSNLSNGSIEYKQVEINALKQFMTILPLNYNETGKLTNKGNRFESSINREMEPMKMKYSELRKSNSRKRCQEYKPIKLSQIKNRK